MRFPSCEIEEDNLRVSHGKQVRTKSKESFESKVLKQKQLCVAVPLPSWFRKLPINVGKACSAQFTNYNFTNLQ